MKKEIETGKLYPKHEELLQEGITEDKLLIKIVRSRAFRQMDLFLRCIGTDKIINKINNLDRNDPKQLKLLIRYKKTRKIIITNFRNAVKEYVKFEKECEKNAKRRKN